MIGRMMRRAVAVIVTATALRWAIAIGAIYALRVIAELEIIRVHGVTSAGHTTASGTTNAQNGGNRNGNRNGRRRVS